MVSVEDSPALADVIASAAGSCPGVVIGPDHVQVNVVTGYGTPLMEIVAGLTAALVSFLDGRALWVSVDDITLPDDPIAAPATASGTSGARAR